MRPALAVILSSIALLAVAPITGAQAAGAIQGTVTEASGSKSPIKEVEVSVLDATSGEFVNSATTGPTGGYEVAGLPAGFYKVQFAPTFGSSELAGQFYAAKATFASAEPVSVKEATTTTGIDAKLAKGATISGTVEAEGVGPAGTEVVALPVGGGEPSFFGIATSKVGGGYTLAGAPPGEYIVDFMPRPGENLVPQLWDKKESFAEATHVAVSGEAAISNIDANLRVGAQISGTVTDAVTHQPLANVFVLAVNSRGFEFFGGDAMTDANGRYTVAGLATGSYSLDFFAEGTTQYLALKSGLVGVTQPNTTSGINVSLTRAAPVNTSAPVVAGTPTVGGQPLSCSTGSWTGKAILKYTYQWTRDGSAIANATANFYVAQSVDRGHGVACQVTATNSAGRATATSNILAVPAPPVVNSPPLIAAGPIATLQLAASRTIKAIGGVAKVRVSCRAARCAGTLQLVQQVVTKTRKGHHVIVRRRTIVLGSGAYVLAPGRSGLVSVRLTSAGRGRLARARGHRLSATLVLAVRGGKTTKQAVSVVAVKAAARRRR
jgi:Carboxypeptidase regulatory-like domain